MYKNNYKFVHMYLYRNTYLHASIMWNNEKVYFKVKNYYLFWIVPIDLIDFCIYGNGWSKSLALFTQKNLGPYFHFEAFKLNWLCHLDVIPSSRFEKRVMTLKKIFSQHQPRLSYKWCLGGLKIQLRQWFSDWNLKSGKECGNQAIQTTMEEGHHLIINPLKVFKTLEMEKRSSRCC